MEDMAMRNYDLTNFSRSSIGFEPFFSILNGASRRIEAEGNFPPYDIIKRDDANYCIRLAVAGFSPDDITITAQQNLLKVAGRKASESGKQYLHEGITDTEFERQFSLADHVEVTGAGYDKGILEIDLRNEVPEAAKPRKISINGGSAQKRLS
jgi:molecular chaperone IbpA